MRDCEWAVRCASLSFCILRLPKALDVCAAFRSRTMASKRRAAQDASYGRRCSSKPTVPIVKRIAKGAQPRIKRERRRSATTCRGGKLISAAFFHDLAKVAVEEAPEYLRQRVGYPLPMKGMFVYYDDAKLIYVLLFDYVLALWNASSNLLMAIWTVLMQIQW